jgi:hypothetical protein
MWFLSLPPLLALHGLAHHWIMRSIAPFYSAFDTEGQHAWTGRATALMVQGGLIPLTALFGTPTSCLHVIGMYMVADMAHMSLYHNSRLTWFHHVLAFLSYCSVFFVRPQMIYVMMLGVVILEVSSICIHLCWFANKMDLAGRWWFRWLAAFTLFQYFLLRCIVFPLYVFFMTPKVMWVSGVIFSVMNWIWFGQLVGYATAVMRKAGGERLE